MDGDRAIVVCGRGDVVDAIGLTVVCLEEALRVVDRDRPEPIDGYVPDRELVLAYGKRGFDSEVARLPVGETSPAGCGRDQVANRVDIALGTERVIEAAEVFGEFEQGLACRVQAGGILVRHFERP